MRYSYRRYIIHIYGRVFELLNRLTCIIHFYHFSLFVFPLQTPSNYYHPPLFDEFHAPSLWTISATQNPIKKGVY